MGLFSLLSNLLHQYSYSASAAFGVAVHNALFIEGEWHLQGPFLVVLHCIACAVLFLWLLHAASMELTAGLIEVLRLFGSYCIGLFGSMTIYRCFFHRLRAFPGPKMAKITKLWHAWHCLGSQNHLFLHRMHSEYGQFVRTGPSEITVFHPDIHHITDGQGNTCSKAAWYDMMTPELSVVSVRDKKIHDARRRVWDKGFDLKSLKYYDQRVLLYVSQLKDLINRSVAAKEPIVLNKIFYWFGWDVMSDVIFGRPFLMLQYAEWHDAVIQLKRAMSLLGPISPVYWLAHLAFKFIPGVWVVKDWFETIDLCRQRMQDRLKTGNYNPDVSSEIVKDAKRNGVREEDQHWLTGDGVLAVMAGSDTVTGTLVALFYRLAEDSKRQDRLFAELQDIDVTNITELTALPYLTALINETLRLHPALPSGGARETGPEGIWIGDTFIPGNTTIIAPKYSIGRMEECFEQGEEFIPERWTSRPHMVRNIAGFTPFGVGRYGCVGRNLALSELRFVAASLMKTYRVKFAPGEDGNRFQAEMRDYFTPKPGQVDVVFTAR